MPTQCQGCNVFVKRSGLYPHFRTSSNALCQQYRIILDGKDLVETVNDDVDIDSQDESENWLVNQSTVPNVEGESTCPKATDREAEDEEQVMYMPQDVDKSEEEDDDYWQEMDISEYKDQDADKSLTEFESESEYEELEASLALDECRLEPIRPSVDLAVDQDEKEDLPQKPSIFRLRGGYEEPLKNDPFVVKFGGMAGRPCTVSEEEEMDAATTTNGVASDLEANPFAPFLSQMDWEIARWAKLRGPGSTAFSELISIDGVSKVFFD